MEKKLLRKIALSFLAAEFVLIGIFAAFFYWNEGKGKYGNADLVLNQFEAAYERAEERMLKKRDMYADDYQNRGSVIDFILGKNPEMQSTEGLQELCRRMQVGPLFLLDADGRILAGSSPEYTGEGLLDNEDSGVIRELLTGGEQENGVMVLDSEAVFERVPPSDFVVMRSALEEYAALFFGIDDAIRESVAYAADVGNVLGSVPVVSGQTLLVIDPDNGRVLGSTQAAPYGEQIDAETLERFREADEMQVTKLYGCRAVLKSRRFGGMLLVSIQDYVSGIRMIALQVCIGAMMLVLIFFVLIIIVRQYFRQYVFSEFAMIEDTVRDLISGKENAQFYTKQDTEMQKIVETLNKLIHLNVELEQAVRDSDKDSITGLVNRNGFEKYIKTFMKRPDKKGVMLMMDVDNFKSVNDHMGHPEGDRVLKVVAECLKSVFRENDTIVRLGGDEFVVFLDTDIPEAKLVEKLEEIIRSLHREVGVYYKEYHVSISIGAAVLKPEVTDYRTLYQCADEALYEAKHTGKDRYVIYTCKEENAAANTGAGEDTDG